MNKSYYGADDDGFERKPFNALDNSEFQRLQRENALLERYHDDAVKVIYQAAAQAAAICERAGCDPRGSLFEDLAVIEAWVARTRDENARLTLIDYGAELTAEDIAHVQTLVEKYGENGERTDSTDAANSVQGAEGESGESGDSESAG